MDNDRRLYPRVTTDHLIRIRVHERVYVAVMLDISLMGAQILCDAATADCITHALNDGVDTVRVSITHNNNDFNADCYITYMRHTGDDECRFGMQFSALLDNSYVWLEDFLDASALLTATVD